jgi:hypothetical protein
LSVRLTNGAFWPNAALRRLHRSRNATAARPDGTLPDDEYREYLRWKKRAAWALQCKVGELGALRRWRHANIAPKDRGLQPSPERKHNDRRHLARCAHTLGRVREHLDDEGLLILNAAEAHLREG